MAIRHMQFLKKMAWPFLISVLLAVCLWLSKTAETAISFLLGAAACWIANLVYAIPLLQKMRSKSSKGFLWVFYLAETVKILLYGVLFVAGIWLFKAKIVPMLAGFILNLFCFWFIYLYNLGKN